MDKRDRNEQAFETLLAENLSAPPETVVAGVTPGHRALRRVLWGSALCTVTLQVSGLQYILPTVGLVLLLLGFRALRRENRWFCAGFRLCGAWFACAAAGLALRAAIAPETASSWLGYAAAALELAVFLCFWRGLDAVQRKAGLPSGKSAAALFFWYVLLVALTFARPNVGWLFAAVILAAYLCVLRSLFRLTRVLDESGYAVRPAAVRVPDGWLAAGLTAWLAACIACGYPFGGGYAVGWGAPPPPGGDAREGTPPPGPRVSGGWVPGSSRGQSPPRPRAPVAG